jgi:AcrR family transcriptional regulator
VLFAERGFAATSVRDIAAAAGLTAGALYNHFDSKEAILNAIAVEGHQALVDSLQRVTRYRYATAADELDALVDALTLFCVEHAVLTRVFEQDYAQLRGANQERILELRRTTLTIFETAIKAGVRSREFSLPTTHPRAPRLLARTIVNTLVLMSASFDEFRPFDDDELMAFYRELVHRMTLNGARARTSA